MAKKPDTKMQTSPPLIFLSHARGDNDRVLAPLLQHLQALHLQNRIRFWIDLDLEPGSEWRPELAAAISEASAAVLLVSKTFLASEFIQHKELPLLREEKNRRKLPILPLILEECLWERVDLISDATIWPNDHRRFDELTENELNFCLVEFVQNLCSVVAVETEIVSLSRYATNVDKDSKISIFQATPPIGRQKERDEAITLLRGNRGLVLFGVPGQGKTELARYIALEVAGEYPDGIFEVDLQNERKIENLPRLIANALDLANVSSSYEALEQRRSLILLDAFDQLLLSNEPENIRHTLSSLINALRSGSRIIITSQQRIDKDGLVTKQVPRLPPNFSLELFQRVSDDWYPDSELSDVREFVDQDLAGHPLSIKIVAGYSSAVRIPLPDVRRLWREKWAEIAKHSHSLDDRGLLTSFELSYATLSHFEQLWFVVMSLLPDGISARLVKEIWPHHEVEIYNAVRTLVARALLDDRERTRDIIRLLGPLFRFAAEKCFQVLRQNIEPFASEIARLGDALDSFVDGYVRINAPQHTDADPRAKNDLIRTLYHNIHASLDRRLEPSTQPSTLAAANDVLSLYWAYHNNLSPVDNPMSSPVDAINYLEKAHNVFIANRKTAEAIKCRYYIGNILWLRGEVEKAKAYLEETTATDQTTDQIRCDCQRAFAHIEYKEGSLHRSVRLYEAVIKTAASIGYFDCINRCLIGAIDAHRKLEEFDTAVGTYLERLYPALSSCHASIRGNAIRAYAYVLAARGDYELAEEQYKLALQVFDGVSPFGQAHCRRGLGDVYVQLDNLSDAAHQFDSALKLYDEAQKNRSLGVGLVALGRGRLYAAQDNSHAAITEFRDAAKMFDRQELNEPYELAVVHEELGDLYLRIGQSDQARANYQIALATFERMEADVVVARIRTKLQDPKLTSD